MTKLLRVPEAAQALRVSQATIYRLIASDELASCKFGRTRVIPDFAIEAFIRRNYSGEDMQWDSVPSIKGHRTAVG